MSKYVKGLITDHVRTQMEGAQDALLVSMVGVDSNINGQIRTDLASKGIRVLFVKNSLARRACVGSKLEGLFDNVEGSVAVCWGAADVVSLAKEIVRLSQDKRFAPGKNAPAGTGFLVVGGIMDGDVMSPEMVVQVSKWASREETIAKLVGQILGPGANLAAALVGPGAALASQIKSKSEGEDAEAAPAVDTAS